MIYDAIVSDWNGTLFKPKTDEGLNRAIAYAALNRAVDGLKHGRFWKAYDVARLALTRGQLKKAIRRYETGEIPITEVYGLFNRRVLRGMPVWFFDQIVDGYARATRTGTCNEILTPVVKASKAGKWTGILSVSNRRGINATLSEVGVMQNFHDVVAHGIDVEHGKVMGLKTEIYGRKAQTLDERFFRGHNLRPETTLYIGDSEEDEPVAGVLPDGNFIVSLLAGEDFRQKMAAKHKAFVPEDSGELDLFLGNK